MQKKRQEMRSEESHCDEALGLSSGLIHGVLVEDCMEMSGAFVLHYLMKHLYLYPLKLGQIDGKTIEFGFSGLFSKIQTMIEVVAMMGNNNGGITIMIDDISMLEIAIHEMVEDKDAARIHAVLD
ncbi:hypothetical protein J5N97_009984 [Dioscorea zingiberensis]|uniref:Uncharacterized protein n=1 Tax=Dioscorea zingiberensis TaxID=325984 RepID=A0A9D5CZD8_9LILI|nr:hypothetical protein J5N97_009984 [Dioscorea zingiberensis]